MSVLVVELLEAKDIAQAGKSATNALFCTIGVGGTRKKSKTIRNSFEPKWEQAFELYVLWQITFDCQLANWLF